MLISRITNTPLRPVFQVNFTAIHPHKPNKTVQNNDVFEKQTKHVFDEMVEEIKNKRPNIPIDKVFYNAIDKKNLLGSGTFAKVYSIPEHDDYVIRIAHNTPRISTLLHPIKATKDEFPNDNFGQKIADNGHGITILKRVYGSVHGFTNPSEKDDDAMFLPEHAKLILSQIEELATFPLKSYEEFALKIKRINESTDFRLDFANANNLLIDKPNKKINIVDLSESKDVIELQDCKQDSSDMISLLLNAVFHRKVYEKLLTQEQKDALIKNSKIVINKALTAAENVELLPDKHTGREKLGKLNDYCIRVINKDCDFLNRYDGFKELYSNVL